MIKYDTIQGVDYVLDSEGDFDEASHPRDEAGRFSTSDTIGGYPARGPSEFHKETDTGKSYIVRKTSKDYGLKPSEARKFLEHPDFWGVKHAHESWREKNGLPARDSPISRGRLISLLRGSK